MLRGNKLILRPLRIEDLEKTNEWRNNIELIILTQGVRFPKTKEMDKEWFDIVLRDKSNRNIYFGIDELESKEFIGIIQICNIDYISGTGEFGIVIGKKNIKGKGYGREAMELILNYAFRLLNLRKINLRVVKFNENAIFLYKKLGFKEEGILQKQIFYEGEYHDVLIMSLFKEDFNHIRQFF